MSRLPNPLEMETGEMFKLPAKRILSDRGIRQAMEFGLIKTVPKFDYHKDPTRIQPATLDLRIGGHEGAEIISPGIKSDKIKEIIWPKTIALPARAISEVSLSELVDFGQFDGRRGLTRPNYLNIMIEARSSLRRFGAYMPNWGMYFFSDSRFSHLEVGNFSLNDIYLKSGERIAQAFFRVLPFADYHHTSMGYPFKARPLKSGEKIRSLDMGIELTINEQLIELQRKGYFKVTPKLAVDKGGVIVHASKTAFKMKRMKKGIDFTNRDKYDKGEILEPIDISKGYLVKPFEHVLIEVKEKFYLSSNVGIEFWDNLIPDVVNDFRGSYNTRGDMERMFRNIPVIGLPDGWIDPGYSGMFSRQPKWLTGRVIHPGDPIGFGQVFFFPNGVENPYGSEKLGSQYHKNKNIAFSRK